MKILEKLNGWVRLGIVLTVLWLLTVAVFAVYEYATAQAYLGSRVSIQRHFYFVKQLTDGQITWDNAPLTFQVRPLLAALLLPPVALWITIPLIAVAVRWVMAGFRSDPRG